MKRIISISLAAVLFLGLSASKTTKAQDGSFAQGKLVISGGYGFPNLGKSILKTYESNGGYSAYGMGPLHFKLEYGLSDKVGFGLGFNFVNYGSEFTRTDFFTTVIYTDNIDVSSMSVLARLNVHFGTTDKLDPYWGIGIGYGSRSWSYTSTEAGYVGGSIKNPIPVGFETTIGLRYYIIPLLGIYAEMGIAKSLIQGGLSFKF